MVDVGHLMILDIA